MEPVKIVIDTREQLPYAFESENIEVVRKALPAGDYSIEGFESEIAIERKTLDDFVASVTRNHERFSKVLSSMSSCRRACVVVEGSIEEVLARRYRSRAHPRSVYGAALSIVADFNIPVFFLVNRQLARDWVEKLLLRYHSRLRQP